MRQPIQLASSFLACGLIVTAFAAHGDVLKCKIEGYKDDVIITTPPDTNQSDGQYARIGASRGIGNRALIFADRMGANAFVELNADATPIGLLTLQRNMRAIKSSHSIDPLGTVMSPSQSSGVCIR